MPPPIRGSSQRHDQVFSSRTPCETRSRDMSTPPMLAAIAREYQAGRRSSRRPDPIARHFGIGVTDLEMFLTGLGLPAPSAAPSGDKPRARK